MTAIERINQFSHRIFNTSKNEQSTSRTSNPFAASNFQKNILTEDVFESSKEKESNKISFTGSISSSSKRIYSTFVGSINDFGNKFNEGIESIISFGNRMKEGFINSMHKLHEIGCQEISISGTRDIISRGINSIFNSRSKEISRLSKMDPKTEIQPMLSSAISDLSAEISSVA